MITIDNWLLPSRRANENGRFLIAYCQNSRPDRGSVTDEHPPWIPPLSQLHSGDALISTRKLILLPRLPGTAGSNLATGQTANGDTCAQRSTSVIAGVITSTRTSARASFPTHATDNDRHLLGDMYLLNSSTRRGRAELIGTPFRPGTLKPDSAEMFEIGPG
jgi:hypothetical protein